MRVRFLSPLDTRKYKHREFVLLGDYIIEFKLRGVWYRLVIPKGFITDFASVPKLVQLLPQFDVNDDSAYAAVPHDYVYACGGYVVVTDISGLVIHTLQLTRDECDQLLYFGLVAKGYSRVVASAFYAGVCVGGAAHFQKRSEGLKDDYDFVPDSYWTQTEIAA